MTEAFEPPAQVARKVEIDGLDDLGLSGATVLLRVDINAPIDPRTGTFLDERRIQEIMPTLDRLAGNPVVMLAHQSRPGRDDYTSLAPHARALSHMMKRDVQLSQDLHHAPETLERIKNLQPSDILLLDNVRFLAEEIALSRASPEQMVKSHFVRELSSVSDVFVNDAFACSHRSSPSTVGFTHTLPAAGGQLMMKEVTALNNAIRGKVSPSAAVLGGIKLDDTVRIGRRLLEEERIDEVWMIGGAAAMFLRIAGHEPGQASFSALKRELGDIFDSTMKEAEELWQAHESRIRLPIDVALATKDGRMDVSINELPSDDPIEDIGLQSAQALSVAIRNAKLVIANGPAGVFEKPAFSFGTIEMLNACAEMNGDAVLGGGHTVTLCTQRGLIHRMAHVSTGGGACLDLLSGRPMPVLEALAAARERRLSGEEPTVGFEPTA